MAVVRQRSTYVLAALMGTMGVLHFAVSKPFESIVPPFLGNERFWVLASGAGELAAAAMLVHPRSRVWGARWCMLFFILVFPANVYMAVDARGSGLREVVSWARLPLQPVLIWWAWRIAKAAQR